jgi:mRNA interferase RelE/StbE
MAWQVELSNAAQKQLAALDKSVARRLLSFLHERIAPLDNPRSIGEALKGARLGSLWKYRVGDYRIISQLVDQKLIIQVVKLGNRREVYR